MRNDHRIQLLSENVHLSEDAYCTLESFTAVHSASFARMVPRPRLTPGGLPAR